jgi:capsular polysaccharide transport system ATP-binding protein
MIDLIDVTKCYPVRGGERTVLDRINMRIHPCEKMGILGRNGSGKSTLVRLMGGAELPTSGRVVRKMSTSWPMALGGGFQGSLTGFDNLRFICRIYGVPFEDKVEFVKEFSELGTYLREPIKSYSNGMRARLAFAISMVIEFDCYLIDEVTSVGDKRFHEKCRVELFEKRKDRAMVIVSHDPGFIREHCQDLLVLVDGKPHTFSSMDEGFDYYQSSLGLKKTA